MDFLDRLLLSPGVIVGISVSSCVVTCLAQFSPLTMLWGQQSLCNLAGGCWVGAGAGGRWVSRAPENTKAISL